MPPTDLPKCSGPAGPYCWTQRPDVAALKGLVVRFGWPDGAATDVKPVVTGVAWKAPGGPPVVLNFCPWCGASLRPAAEG